MRLKMCNKTDKYVEELEEDFICDFSKKIILIIGITFLVLFVWFLYELLSL